MAAALPSDLLHCVLETWLDVDVDAVASLDVAVCNHSMRADLLAVLTRIAVKPHGVYARPIRYLSNYMQWIASRKVKVTDLHLHVLDIEMTAGDLGFISLPSIRQIYFSCEEDNTNSVNYGMLAVFLSKFPCLTAFRGWWTMTDDHLAMVRSFKYKLEELDITACPYLSSSAEAKMIASVAASLVSLQFTPTDETLTALSGVKFPALRSIHIDCWHMEEQELISEFCVAASETLESLCIDCRDDNHIEKFPQDDGTDNCLTHETAESITKVCKKLTSFTFYCKPEEDCLSLRAVLENVPHLRELGVGDSVRLTLEESSGWEIRVEFGATEFITEIVVGFRGRISRITSVDHHAAFTDASLRLTASKFGAHLIHFQSQLDDDVDDNTLAYVLPHLPNLECFQFGVYRKETITDASLTLLPVCCPKITDLRLRGNITDQGMCAILDGYRGKHMTSLNVARCKLLTDITLIKIAETFPDLKHLDIRETSIDKKTIVRLIVLKKLRAKEIFCEEDALMRAALTQFGNNDT